MSRRFTGFTRLFFFGMITQKQCAIHFGCAPVLIVCSWWHNLYGTHFSQKRMVSMSVRNAFKTSYMFSQGLYGVIYNTSSNKYDHTYIPCTHVWHFLSVHAKPSTLCHMFLLPTYVFFMLTHFIPSMYYHHIHLLSQKPHNDIKFMYHVFFHFVRLLGNDIRT